MPINHLRNLVNIGKQQRWPEGVADWIEELLEKELGLIEELEYEYYFLTVHDIVRFAREQGILCQGRGSAANSVVCYCLFITEIAPGQIGVLFERFISRERDEPPDIDVDFEHQRREEVIQYIDSGLHPHKTLADGRIEISHCFKWIFAGIATLQGPVVRMTLYFPPT
jgi:error-prone DNA polymerase